MNEEQTSGGSPPEAKSDGALPAAAPERGAAAKAVVPVVGVGASAGGLETFKILLADLPDDTGLAIVFVQHLDPKRQSMLTEILGRATSMPICEAADGMPVEANHVYIIPSNADLTIADGALKLVPRTQTPGSHMPIDRFLRSVADHCGSTAIGVILSGTGSDGSAGIEAIKGAGGVTLAQDPATARFGTMPQAAVATGCVDFVLPPERIAAELVRICRHPYILDAQQTLPERTQVADDEGFANILAILHVSTGIDFSRYREKMIKRRILRRLALRNISSLAEYTRRLESDADERIALQQDLLISVTSFFRDLKSFESLKRVVFPKILQGRAANDTIRVWVVGCATGEEAFSIAISLHEYQSQTGSSFPVQIFASDVSMAAIENARTGKFLENIAADLTPDRLNRYFTRVEGGYQVNRNLREMCVFTRHNLLDDPPFSKLDLISCRNVLIYLGSVQKDILPVFHYALKPTGFLLLGASESAASEDLFSVADREHRLYAKRESSRRPTFFPVGARGAHQGARPDSGRETPKPELWGGLDVRKEVDRILLSKYSPAGVVVDDDLDVIEIRGNAGAYLTLPVGKVSFNLVRLIPDTALFLSVEKLIRQARESGEPARQEGLSYRQDGNATELTVEVVPLDSNRKRSALILLEPSPRPAERAADHPGGPSESDPRDRQIAWLKQQLAEAKERFLVALESHQTSREENQNTTEEALSANEELQSLNEELETAKEELQSTNEELITVNDELQVKNAALSQARDLAMSIVETVRRPLLVLDSELRIKLANHAFYEAFRVSPLETEGQLIYSLSWGSWDLPALRDALGSLRKGASSFPDFEVQQDFPGLGRRSLLFGGGRIDHLKMILLSVDDITERKLAQQALRRGEEHLRQSQKMEAVGRIAGGVAHDFNNLLTAIIGYSALLDEKLSQNEPARQQVLEIKSAGERAAALTQQLLAFSKRQALQPRVLDLNTIVADFDRMLRRLLGERINVTVVCEPALWQVMADPGEIGRALINLTLNARDAMPEGGTLTVETANVTVTEADAPKQGLAPGRYVVMAVHDTGVGIDPEMQAHIFEPFFTTKETGKGTGLGLATVERIVEQSGGKIYCESHPGEGTTFRILLPAIAEVADHGTLRAGDLDKAPKGSEAILLVEDEDAVRKFARTVLEACGYVVHDARDGHEALEFSRAHPGPIDLMLFDVVMPEPGGRELAERALKVRPELKVLFMSAHTQDVVLKEGVQKRTPTLQKPFTPIELAQKVREALDD